MQVGATSGLSAQLLGLQSAAQNEYQDGSDFSFALNQAMAGQGGAAASAPSSSTPSSSASSSPTLSGGFQSDALYAVGTIGANGQVNLFSQQQIGQEQAQIANAGKLAYGDALQNFLALAQAASPDGGPTQAASITDQQQFVGDNGLISANFTSQFNLQPGSSS